MERSTSDILAWDPDFTKLTPDEAAQLKAAEAGEFIDSAQIDWSKIGQ